MTYDYTQQIRTHRRDIDVFEAWCKDQDKKPADVIRKFIVTAPRGEVTFKRLSNWKQTLKEIGL